MKKSTLEIIGTIFGFSVLSLIFCIIAGSESGIAISFICCIISLLILLTCASIYLDQNTKKELKAIARKTTETTYILCPSCSKKNKKENKFCRYCGTDLRKAQSEEDTIGELKAKLFIAETEYTAKLNSKDQQIKKLKIELENFQKEISNSNIEELNQNQAALIAKLQEKIELLTAELTEQEQHTQENQKQSEQIQILKEQLTSAYSEYATTLEAKEAQITNLQNDINQLQQNHTSFEKSKQRLKKENQALKRTLDSFTAHDDFRKRNPANFLCSDGHWVRSKAERDIDNFFFQHHISHVFEKEYYCNNKTYYPDFYLPDQKLYIEYFGRNDTEYLEKKEQKIEMYSADPTHSFEYLTSEDDNCIEEKLNKICNKYNIPIQ